MLVTLLLLAQFAQANAGEVRVTVNDPSGTPLVASVSLSNDAAQVNRTQSTGADGRLTLQRLPFGTYELRVAREGFTPDSRVIEVRSQQPATLDVTLSPAQVRTSLTVRANGTLLAPRRTNSVQYLGGETLDRRPSALPGRALPDLVSTQPGWLLEANGVLHPRGSEYQTQIIVDGLPETENRSPAFAPELSASQVRAMSIVTGGYPAEYGRKLGGVIEVITGGDARLGLHGMAGASGGSFNTGAGDAMASYGMPHLRISAAGNGSTTDRYLDPPVQENFTNRGRNGGASARLEADITNNDRLGVLVRAARATYQVPNEGLQELAGQRQHATAAETAGLFSYDHRLSPQVSFDVRGMGRRVSASLRSNTSSTPIVVQQNRGFNEGYLRATLSARIGNHEIKAGADADVVNVHEQFAYQINDPDDFDDDVAGAFALTTRAPDREYAAFVQDLWQQGAWTVSAGLRWDRYRFLVRDAAWSPRVAAAWSSPTAGVVLHASYDRVFQTPAIENLLLASSSAVSAINTEAVHVPVSPSRGNFYEVGVSKGLAGAARLDVTYFQRRTGNFADDDVLLNTGVSFPVAFARAIVRGTEATISLPRRGPVSASASYSHLRGTGYLPVTGGLFLDEDADLLTAQGSFPISQDQRHTVSARVITQVTPVLWMGLATAYGSGLPVEFDGSRADIIEEYGARIADRVNVEAGRVKPRFSLDASVGLALRHASTRSLDLQLDVRNLTNRFDVINFSGLFSGTALAPPRSVALRLRAAF